MTVLRRRTEQGINSTQEGVDEGFRVLEGRLQENVERLQDIMERLQDIMERLSGECFRMYKIRSS
jgi:hypothetical protein